MKRTTLVLALCALFVVGCRGVGSAEGIDGPTGADRAPTERSTEATSSSTRPTVDLPGSAADAVTLEFEVPDLEPLIGADEPATLELPGDVLFATADSELRPQAEAVLADLHAQLVELPADAHLTVVGHTDSRGDAAGNQALSEDRAAAVRNWFVAHGHPRRDIQTAGAGETELLVADVDEDGVFDEDAGRHNRRVTITVDLR